VELPSAALDAGTPEVTAPDVGVPEISAPEDAAPSVSAAMAGVEVPSAVPDITAPGVEGAAAVELPGTDVADVKAVGEPSVDITAPEVSAPAVPSVEVPVTVADLEAKPVGTCV
jgi:hypothetical protein